jgi:hypothetical protein
MRTVHALERLAFGPLSAPEHAAALQTVHHPADQERQPDRRGGGSLLSGHGRDRSADHVDGVVGYAVAHGDVDDGFAKLGWWHGRVLS